MKRIIALALVMVMALGLAACGAKAEDANTVGTGKLETTEGETIQDVSKLEPAANINPSTLNIGHAIIGRAVMSGLKEAVSEMKRLMQEARQ